jgi:hypothetical protein
MVEQMMSERWSIMLTMLRRRNHGDDLEWARSVCEAAYCIEFRHHKVSTMKQFSGLHVP